MSIYMFLLIIGSLLGIFLFMLVRFDKFNSLAESAALGILRVTVVGLLAAVLFFISTLKDDEAPCVGVLISADSLSVKSNLFNILERLSDLENEQVQARLAVKGSIPENRRSFLSYLADEYIVFSEENLIAPWASANDLDGLIIMSALPPDPSLPVESGIDRSKVEWLRLEGERETAKISSFRLPRNILKGQKLKASATFYGNLNGYRLEFKYRHDAEPIELDLKDKQSEDVGWEIAEDEVTERPGLNWGKLDLITKAGKLADSVSKPFNTWKVGTIHYVSTNHDAPLRLLLSKMEFDVRDRLPNDLTSLSRDVSGNDLVVLDSVSPGFLNSKVVEALVSAVGGKGATLLVIPGVEQASGFKGSIVESILPNTFTGEDDNDEDGLSFLVITDTSMSMGMVPHGVDKIDMVRDALFNLSVALPLEASFGIMGVDENPYWVQNIDEIRDLDQEGDRILRIGAFGGGINLYSGLKEAYDALTAVDAGRKHILLFLDTADIDQYSVYRQGDVWELLEEMRLEGITCSFIGFGYAYDKHVPQLERLAATAGGYFYLASDMLSLPSFSLSDLEQVRKDPVRRTKTKVIHVAELIDFPSNPPLLNGFIASHPIPEAKVAIKTVDGMPILSIRKLGSGKVAFFATDSGSQLASSWFSNESSPDLTRALLASIAPEKNEGTKLFSTTVNGELQVKVKTPPEENKPALFSGDEEVSLTKLSPNTYEAVLPYKTRQVELRTPSLTIPVSSVARKSAAPSPQQFGEVSLSGHVKKNSENIRAIIGIVSMLALTIYAIEETLRTN